MRTFIISLLALIFCQSGFSQQDSLLIKMEIMHELNNSREEFLKAFRLNLTDSEPDLRIYYGDRFVDKIYQRMEAEGYDSIMSAMIPIYMQYFTEEDVEVMIDFYKTETGKKAAGAMAEIMTYSYRIGEQYGERLFQRLFEEHQQELKAAFESVNRLECNKLKEGTFYNISAPGDTVRIERKLDMQIERGTEFETHLLIEWVDQCRYKLIPMEGDSGLGFNDALEVNITAIEENGYYAVYKIPGENIFSETYIWW